MQDDYQGWDAVEDSMGEYQFAEVHGIKKGDNTFVITDFGGSNDSRHVISAMMAAVKQFKCKLHVRKNASTMSLLTKLTEASMLKVAPVRGGDHEELGVLGMRATPPVAKKPWWKFW